MANYKRLYLDGYSYYITLVTHERNPILIQNITLLRQSFAYAKTLFDFDIQAIVIMPDHLHMILYPHTTTEYPKIISSIKRHFSKHCPKHYYAHLYQSYHRQKQGYLPVWQKRFYEHTIRDEKDFQEKITYMQNNPVKHGYVRDIHTWQYSSFHKHRRCDRVTRHGGI